MIATRTVRVQVKRLKAAIASELADLRVDVVSCCGSPFEHETTLEEADRSPVEDEPQDPQAGLYMVGGASRAVPPLPNRTGRVTNLGGG